MKPGRCESAIFHHLGKSGNDQTPAVYGAGRGDVGVASTADAELGRSSFLLSGRLSISQIRVSPWELGLFSSLSRSQMNIIADPLSFSLTGKLSAVLLCHLCFIHIPACLILAAASWTFNACSLTRLTQGLERRGRARSCSESWLNGLVGAAWVCLNTEALSKNSPCCSLSQQRSTGYLHCSSSAQQLRGGNQTESFS